MVIAFFLLSLTRCIDICGSKSRIYHTHCELRSQCGGIWRYFSTRNKEEISRSKKFQIKINEKVKIRLWFSKKKTHTLTQDTNGNKRFENKR